MGVRLRAMERMILGLSGKGSVYVEDASVFFTHGKQYVLWKKMPLSIFGF